MQTTHNENKRKKVFLIATLLLALLLIFAFGTYSLSKYVSQDKGSGDATIAKWGYKVDINADNLFGKEYQKVEGESWATVDGEGEIVVKASEENQNNVIAPGTKGSMTISVTGNAEVAAALTFDFGESKLPSFTITRTVHSEALEQDVTLTYEYSPVKLTMQKYSDSDFQTPVDDPVEGLDAIKATLENQTYSPNADVLETYYEINWEWAFTADGDVTPNVSEEATDIVATDYNLSSDDLDTIIGIYSSQGGRDSVNYNGENYTIDGTTAMNLDLTIALTQVQELA